MRRRRTNRVAEDLAVAAAFLAGGIGALAPPAPTGHEVVDAVLVGGSIAAVVWAAASAPWWVLVVAAGVAMAIAVDALLVAIAAVGLLVALWIGVQRRNLPEWRAVSAGISMNVLAWAELGGFHGLSALLAIATAVFVFVLGVRRRPRRIRRRAWIGAGVVGLGAIVSAGAFGVAAASSRSDLEAGQDFAEAGIDLLNEGDFAGAAEQFEQAAQALDEAEDRMSQPWVAVAGAVPVVAQHHELAADLSRSGAAATRQVADALRQVDPSSLTLTGGVIDLAAIPPLAQPFADVDAALEDLAATVADVRSPWIIGPLDDELDSLAERLAEHAPRLDNARDAVDLAPQLLGGNGPRRYLVLFTTPAEARGLGGFAGNYAELTFDAGRVSMTDFGRTSDLEQRAREIGARVTGPPGFLDRYQRFIANEEGVVGEAPFRNLTMTAHFPWVGEVAAELYPQITGREVDGVIAMDPFVVASLLTYTGDVQLTSVPYTLTAENATDFLLVDQYVQAQSTPERIDALEEAARATFDAVLASSLPDPVALARDLGPLVEERRLLVWTKDDAEQDLLRRVGLLGNIPPHDDAPAWALTVTNGGASKIDSYLQRAAAFSHQTDPDTGQTTATLQVELTNNAPASGLPDYVIGNSLGLPPGTSRLYVSVYSSLPVASATLNGEPIGLVAGTEAGWEVASQFIDIASGETVALEVQFTGRLDRPDADVVTWTQPLAQPLESLE